MPIKTAALICLNMLIYLQVAAQNQQMFCGRILDLNDSLPIVDALVISSSGKSAISTNEGSFCIEMEFPGYFEVIHLSHTGKFTMLDSNQNTFYLGFSTFDLDSATVHFKYNRIAFDKKFIDGNLPTDSITLLRKNLQLDNHKVGINSPGISAHPITYLYDRYSKSAMRKAEYERVIKEDNRIALLRNMMNTKVLSSILNTDDLDQINCFFLFCSIDPRWVEDHSELEIIAEAKRCELDFTETIDCDWPNDLYFPH